MNLIHEATSIRKTFIYLFIFFFIIFLISTRFSPSSSYKGDGYFRDNGRFRLGGYQYKIDLNQFTVDQTSMTMIYNFSGASSEKYTFQLDVVPSPDMYFAGNKPTDEDFWPVHQSLKSQQVQIGVKLFQNGIEYVVIDPSYISDSWVQSTWKYFHVDWNEIPLSQEASYELHVTIKSPSELLEPITLQPILYGGTRYVF